MSSEKTPQLMDKILSLCKRRGFVFPGSEIYGGLANSWDYGPVGVELKNKIKQLWWRRFVHMRGDMVGIDAALIMNPKVWQASGHVGGFNDPLVEDVVTNERYRLDHLLEEVGVSVTGMDLAAMGAKLKELGLKSPKGNAFGEPKQFNLMFSTYLGPVQDEAHKAYMRPETAQAMFVQFKNVVDSSRVSIPFGIAQVGRAFRNEITPGNFIFRTREFDQMEIEYFIPAPKTDQEWQDAFEAWLENMRNWVKHDLGIDYSHVHELEIAPEDRAHYSKRTVDLEYKYPFGQKELYGLAYRTDFDLKNHQEASGQDLTYIDPHTNERYLPHCIEPTWGLDRSVLAVLCEHYREDESEENKRVWLQLPPHLAPYSAAVFPLMKNKPELVSKAQEILGDLRATGLNIAWDDRGNVGKRYYAQDEIGTPYGITVDYQTLEDGTVTVRHRDNMTQERIAVDQLVSFITNGVKTPQY